MLTILFSLIICLCFIFIIRDVINYKKADKEYDRLKEYMHDDVDTDTGAEDLIKASYSPGTEESGDDMEVDFDSLYKINKDLVCVLSIPELDLKYPVVKATDNVRYLDRTFEGNKNPAGCLFIDYENSSDLTDANTYIYGHNMKDGSMFGSLKKIKKEDMTDAYVVMKNETYKYRLKNTEVVNIYEYKPPTDEKDLLTLYTCWGNDKSKRLLVTFKKDTV